MQKIEKWRVEELSLVLNELADILKKGNNREWANVFFHFDSEAQRTFQAEKFNPDQFRKLIANIKNCFSGHCSFSQLELWLEDPLEAKILNREFSAIKSELLRLLEDLETRMVEFFS